MIRFVNNVKTAVLLALLFGVVLAAGLAIGGQQGLIIAFVLGLAMNFVAFFFSDKIAIAAMRGKLVDDKTEYAELVHMVNQLADGANLPRPRIYVCPQQSPNAFATGRSPKKAAVAVTQGAFELLTYDELKGVMAHELAHVKNRDTLTSTIAATIAGAINFLTYMFMFGGRNRDIHPGIQIAILLLAPIAAALIQMAISRSREFVADADGAEIAGSPNGLISALQKLEAYSKGIPLESAPTQNHMFIVQPFSAGGLSNLFSTHPATAKRIEKLRQA
ncbi:MAG: M48 family metalloprotease [Phycisphaeraceae bacterium]